MSDEKVLHKGGCLCGGVRYRVSGSLRDIVACYCTQCAQTSGNFVAATSTPVSQLSFDAKETLTWYRSSEAAERGFCRRCGGNLFWRGVGRETISIMAGTLEPPTHLRIARHIFVASKPDYYEINDQAPQHERW
jgi:hypothetical protein